MPTLLPKFVRRHPFPRRPLLAPGVPAMGRVASGRYEAAESRTASNTNY